MILFRNSSIRIDARWRGLKSFGVIWISGDDRCSWCDFIHILLGWNGCGLVWFEVVWCELNFWRWSISFDVILLWFGQDLFFVTLFRSGRVEMGVGWCGWHGWKWFGVICIFGDDRCVMVWFKCDLVRMHSVWFFSSL